MAKNPPPAKSEFITLSAQIGGENAYRRTNYHILKFRGLLARHCKGKFSPVIDELVLIFRINGNAQRFRFRGPARPTLRKKRRFIEIDIGVAETSWADQPPTKFRRFLSEMVDLSIEKCLARLEKAKVPIDRRRLLERVGKAKEEFLSK